MFKKSRSGGFSLANAQNYNIIQNGKVTLDLLRDQHSDMSNINGLDVSKSKGRNIHIVNINGKTVSTDGTYGENTFDAGAYALFHEIDAHIEKDRSHNSVRGHQLHGYSVVSTEINGVKVESISIKKGSDAWNMIMQLIELRKNEKNNENK